MDIKKHGADIDDRKNSFKYNDQQSKHPAAFEIIGQSLPTQGIVIKNQFLLGKYI
jgi:hypothetical protein